MLSWFDEKKGEEEKKYLYTIAVLAFRKIIIFADTGYLVALFLFHLVKEGLPPLDLTLYFLYIV